MGLVDLQEICESLLNNEPFRNLELQSKTRQIRLHRLHELAIKQGLCTGEKKWVASRIMGHG